MICHISIEIILIVSNIIDIHLGNTAVPEQLLLVIHVMMVKQCDRLIYIDGTLADRHFCIYDLMHLCSDLIQKFLIQSCKSSHCKIIAGTNGIMDLHLLDRVLACHIVDCFEQYKAGTSLVRRKSNVVSGRDKFYLTVTLDSLVKFPKPPIYCDQYDRSLCVLLVFINNIPVGSSTGIFFRFAVNCYFCHILFHKNPPVFIVITYNLISTNCFAASCSRNSANIRNPLIYYVNRFFLMFGGFQKQQPYRASTNCCCSFHP